MTLDDFIKKYNGKKVDIDGAYGGQCMDLMHLYIKEMYGLDYSVLRGKSARWVYNNFNKLSGHKKFVKINNTPKGVPEKGDIIFWSWGRYGHVAIFLEGNIYKFKSLDQNYPTGSPVHIQNHESYIGVAGWLKLKNTMEINPKTFNKLVTKSTNADELTDYFKIDLSKAKKAQKIIDKYVKMVNYKIKFEASDEKLKSKDEIISRLSTNLLDKKTEITGLSEQAEKLGKKFESAEKLRAKWYELYQQSERNYKSAKQDLTVCKSNLSKCESADGIYKKPKTMRTWFKQGLLLLAEKLS